MVFTEIIYYYEFSCYFFLPVIVITGLAVVSDTLA